MNNEHDKYSMQLLTPNANRGNKHYRQGNHDSNHGNSNTRIVHILVVTTIEKATWHANALRDFIKHPLIDICVNRHDIIRRRELLWRTMYGVAIHGHVLTITKGDVIILEVVVFILH